MANDNRKAKQAFYKCALWRGVRSAQLTSQPFCFMCNRMGIVTLANVVDHVLSFEDGRDPLAVDSNNLTSLCKQHHDQVTAAYDKHGKLEGMSIKEAKSIKYVVCVAGEDGYPVEIVYDEPDDQNEYSLFSV